MARGERKNLREFHEEYRARVSENRETDHSGWLKDRLMAADSSDQLDLGWVLIGELQRTNQFTEAEKLLLADIVKLPNHPYPLVALAEHFHYYHVDLQRAKLTVARALHMARIAREFGYQCLGIQARLAIETRDWQLLAETLTELTVYRHKTGNVDVFPEKDFLNAIPPNVVTPDLIAAYLRRRAYLSSIGYSTLTGRSIGTRLRRGD